MMPLLARCNKVSDSEPTHAAPLLGVPSLFPGSVLASPGAAFRNRKGLMLPPPTLPSEPSPPTLPAGLLGFGAVAPTEPQLAMSGQSRRLWAALMSRSTNSPVSPQTRCLAIFFDQRTHLSVLSCHHEYRYPDHNHPHAFSDSRCSRSGSES